MADHGKIQPIIITGPTGSGKSAVAMELCELIGGEIISADSMQIYRGMDIGTAKPSLQERQQVPHHLIDIREPDENYSAAQWVDDAKGVVGEIQNRHKVPVICGGTGFYLAALLSPGLLAQAPPNPPLRAYWENYLETHGNHALRERLGEIDASAAARLHFNDTRRVIRALEVADFRSKNAEEVMLVSSPVMAIGKVFGLEWPREILYERINLRVEDMITAGFMEELSQLVAAGYGEASPLQNIGYKQMRPVLQEKEMYGECVEQWKRDTRRYAKRQITWFRHQLEMDWIPAQTASPQEIAQFIKHSLQAS